MDKIARAYQFAPLIYLAITLWVLIEYWPTRNQKIWKYEEDSTIPKNEAEASLEKTKREGKRGTFVSFVLQVIAVISMVLLDYFEYPRQTIMVNFGLIIIPTLNFIGDQLFGTDEGLHVLDKKNPDMIFVFLWEKMGSPIFFRYIITVLLDLFISSPMIDVIKENSYIYIQQLLRFEHSNEIIEMYTNYTGKNIDTLLYTFMQILTFNAYTNQSRFNWAYRTNSSIKNEQTINSGSILLICGLASVFYMTYEYPGATPFETRFFYTTIMLLLLSIGYMNNLVEPKYTKLQEIEKYLAKDAKIRGKGIVDINGSNIRKLSDDENLGVGMFVLFCLYIFYSGLKESIDEMWPESLQFI